MNVPGAGSWACGTQGGWESGPAALARRQCFLRLWPLLHSLHMAGGVEKRHEAVGEEGGSLSLLEKGKRQVIICGSLTVPHFSLGVSSGLVQVNEAVLGAQMRSASLSWCPTWSASDAVLEGAVSSPRAASRTGFSVSAVHAGQALELLCLCHVLMDQV